MYGIPNGRRQRLLLWIILTSSCASYETHTLHLFLSGHIQRIDERLRQLGNDRGTDAGLADTYHDQ